MKSTKSKNPPILARKGMSPEGTEMALHGFSGKGTVTRHEGENFIVIARDAAALRIFWKRWAPEYQYDEAKYSDAITVAKKLLIPNRK